VVENHHFACLPERTPSAFFRIDLAVKELVIFEGILKERAVMVIVLGSTPRTLG
jgi:hypothetical protein